MTSRLPLARAKIPDDLTAPDCVSSSQALRNTDGQPRLPRQHSSRTRRKEGCKRGKGETMTYKTVDGAVVHSGKKKEEEANDGERCGEDGVVREEVEVEG
jgi:hypothetical protein